MRMTWGTNTIDFFYDASGLPYAMKYNGTVYYYITNLQGDVMRIVDASQNIVTSYDYDPYGKVISATGTLANINPLRYRGYVYDTETGFYYLQSRYYDPAVGRFLNADSYATTGQGIIGCNMFAYCGNDVVSNYDISGCRYVSHVESQGQRYDMVIYYSHPESKQNMEEPARRNHSEQGTKFIGVASFDELAQAMNSTPRNVNNVYLYLHGGVGALYFYYDLKYDAEAIEENIGEMKIFGNIYLFSCSGGSASYASAMARATDCNVVASTYKVSFDDGRARGSWTQYILDRKENLPYMWYIYYPDGGHDRYSFYFVNTR